MQILWRLEYKQDGHSESAGVIEESTREKEPEIQTVAAPKRAEKRPLLIVDIPNFQLGNIYIILNLFVIPPVIAYHVVMFVMALPSSNRYVNLHDLIYSSWVILGLGFSFFVILKLRKRKSYAFVLNFILLCLGMLGGIYEMIWGKGTLPEHLGRGTITVWIAFGCLVYFYGKRQYF